MATRTIAISKLLFEDWLTQATNGKWSMDSVTCIENKIPEGTILKQIKMKPNEGLIILTIAHPDLPEGNEYYTPIFRKE